MTPLAVSHHRGGRVLSVKVAREKKTCSQLYSPRSELTLPIEHKRFLDLSIIFLNHICFAQIRDSRLKICITLYNA